MGTHDLEAAPCEHHVQIVEMAQRQLNLDASSPCVRVATIHELR